MSIRYDGQVAIVTGAGGGLGRSHALALAARGAKVIVNDLGGDVRGEGGSVSAASAVVAEIEAAGGEAIANGANVCNADEVAAMVAAAMYKWGRVDILINNAGVLRDKSFVKMTLEEFDFVLQVHLTGAAICSKAVWPVMKEQNYGRIVMTSSSSGLYGNFGQANYGAAKMGVVGLMNVLCIEGAKNNIHVNALAPTAATRMTEGLMPQAALDLLTPESVTAGLLTLCDKDAPNRLVLCAGAGGYSAMKIYETEGIYLSPEDQSPEKVRENMADIMGLPGGQEFVQGGQQTMKMVGLAAAHFGIKM